MVKLVDNLLESYRIGIEDLEWMSEKTKEKALIKLEKYNIKMVDGLGEKIRSSSEIGRASCRERV